MNALGGVADAFVRTELLSAEQVDVHIDSLLHWRYVCVYAANVEERFDIAASQNGSETLACNGQVGKAAADLCKALDDSKS